MAACYLSFEKDYENTYLRDEYTLSTPERKG